VIWGEGGEVVSESLRGWGGGRSPQSGVFPSRSSSTTTRRGCTPSGSASTCSPAPPSPAGAGPVAPHRTPTG